MLLVVVRKVNNDRDTYGIQLDNTAYEYTAVEKWSSYDIM
jgi:hypothetical protein